jgi:nitrate reductase gamma subunit
MNWNQILFLIFPYIALAVLIFISIYRSIYRPFTISSMSSQLLERKKLYWGNIALHYGLILVLLGHLLALVMPKSILLWNAVPVRLYLLETSGLALGMWATVGLVILIYRRASTRRLWGVTSPMDLLVLALLLTSALTGVMTATFYRFGSYWFTGVFTPYLLSIVTFQPRPELVKPLPWVIQLHVFNFWLILLFFPFSRLVHIFTYPIGYLLRPWQIIIWNRRQANRKSFKV